MNNCIFCKIVAGEIPSTKIYEDENTLAFLDIAPVNPGHTLVIPKKHFENIEATPEEVLCQTIAIVKKIGRAIVEGMNLEGYNVTLNNGPVAGQIVRHLHFHLIPRQAGDGHKLWPQRKYQEEEMEEAANLIKKFL